ncbi:MAG: hypothetical protein DSZ05_02820, partial [Sulfurospirillum sp.]
MRRLLVLLILLMIVAALGWIFKPKITPYYAQLTKPHVGLATDLQPPSQKDATYIGSQKCKKCHKDNYHDWKNSMHSKMIQDIR